MIDHQADKPGTWLDRDTAAVAIRRLSEADLRYLNRLIVERLKLISQAHSTAMLAGFSVGDRVRFDDSAGQPRTGRIMRLNKKTASIVTDQGEQWNVAPGFLTRDGA